MIHETLSFCRDAIEPRVFYGLRSLKAFLAGICSSLFSLFRAKLVASAFLLLPKRIDSMSNLCACWRNNFNLVYQLLYCCFRGHPFYLYPLFEPHLNGLLIRLLHPTVVIAFISQPIPTSYICLNSRMFAGLEWSGMKGDGRGMEGSSRFIATHTRHPLLHITKQSKLQQPAFATMANNNFQLVCNSKFYFYFPFLLFTI